MRPRAVFFGTPAFAVPSLEALYEVANVIAVVSQPDRRSGRGLRTSKPPVASRAKELGITVLQPPKVRTPEFVEQIVNLDVDIAVVAAYGRIFDRALLDVPRLGCINVHASLLPRWRGAAPIARAIMAGDTETGISLMVMEEGLDTGPVLSFAKTNIGAEETAGDLGERLARAGAELLQTELPKYVRGELRPVPQDHEAATLAPILEKEHGRIDWAIPASAVHNHVRAMQPWPGAYSVIDGQRLKILRTHVKETSGANAPPGTIVRARREIEIACSPGVISIAELQLEAGKRLGASQFLAGHPWKEGVRFEDLHSNGR